MAPHDFAARDNICGSGWRYNGRVCVRSGWYHWGRWILAGVLILAAVLFFLCCSIFLKRRQRRGAAPMYGTGWLGGRKQNHPQQQQQPPPQYPPPTGPYPYGDPNQQHMQPPYGGYGEPYGQPPAANHMTGETFNPNDGYYGGQQYGVQAPPNAYQYPPK